MNIFKFDSPVMHFIGKVADMIILNILCLICSLPIVTVGASFSAKYYVSMKIVKGEEVTVIRPFFKAFKDNFKQATKIWLIILGVGVILLFDWVWIFTLGYGNVKPIFLILLSVASMYLIALFLSIFPFIARYEVTILEAFKAAALFAFLHYITFLLTLVVEVGSIIASLWYAEWLPAILLFGTTTSFYFINCIVVKGFSKMEKNLDPSLFENEEEKPEKSEDEENGEESVTILRADEHTIKGKFNAEKETFSSLNFKEKLVFIKDYYLLNIIIILCAVGFVIWFIYDGFIGNQKTVYSGGLLYCFAEDKLQKDAFCDGFLQIAGDNIRREQVILSDDLTMDFTEAAPDEIEYDPTQDQYLFPYISAGYYDYFMIDSKFIDHYMLLDCFKDITYMADEYNIPEEDRFYLTEEDENGNEREYVSSFIIPSEVINKAGIYSRTEGDVYIAFVENGQENEIDDKFMKYLYEYEENKDEIE